MPSFMTEQKNENPGPVQLSKVSAVVYSKYTRKPEMLSYFPKRFEKPVFEQQYVLYEQLYEYPFSPLYVLFGQLYNLHFLNNVSYLSNYGEGHFRGKEVCFEFSPF